MTQENQTLEEFKKRDLWLEARQATMALEQPGWMRFISGIQQALHLVRPSPAFGAGTSLMMDDLNKYRPNVNVELLIDQGVRLFGLRIGGPTQWVYGAFNYQVDPTFTMYHERIRAHAKKLGVVVWIVGYGVHNAWSDEDSNYTRPTDPQLAWLKEAVINHKCDLYCWDDEVGTVWMNGRETTITAANLVKSISRLMEQTLQQMERNVDGSFKIPLHYSANWFMKQYARLEYQTWLDNSAHDPANRRFLYWRAWYAQTYSAFYETMRAVIDALLTPTGIQENAYLKMGSEPPADLWQFTSSAKGPWESVSGIVASTGYGLSITAEDFARNANLPTTPPVPDDTTPPSQPGNLVGLVQNGAVTLEWSPSTDDVGVVSYQVARDGNALGATGAGVQTYIDAAVTVGSSYTYQVSARDAAGNQSTPASVTVTVTSTPPPPGGDYTEQLNRMEETLNEIRSHFTPER